MAFLDNELVFRDDGKTLGGLLQNFGNELQDQLRNSLDRNTSSNTSKQGEQSIQFQLEFKELGVWRFRLFMEDYLDFIDEGVEGVGGNRADGTPYRKHRTDGTFKYKKGGIPSAKHFKLWANTKGLNPFAVRTSVFHRGIKATHFYQDVVTDKLISDLSQSLENAGARAVELELVEILQKK